MSRSTGTTGRRKEPRLRPNATSRREDSARRGLRTVQDVCIDYCRGHVAMAEELLSGANVLAALQQVGGEGVAEGVAGHPFVARCILHRPLQDALVEVMTRSRAVGSFPYGAAD